MDRRKPSTPNHLKQQHWTVEPPPTSPTAMSHHHRSSSAAAFSPIKTNQNLAAKAAAQRLAQVMSSHTNNQNDDDDDDDDWDGDGDGSGLVGMVRNSRLHNSNRQLDSSGSGNKFVRNVVDDSRVGRMRNVDAGSIPLRSVSSLPVMDPPALRLEKRFLPVSGLASTQVSVEKQVASALHDEIDNIQEENYSMLKKLKIEEERYQAAEARVKELEKQVASLSEGVSLEAKLLSRKEALLRQKEEELRTKQSKNWVDEEVASLHSKIKDLKVGKAAAVDQLHRFEKEVKALCSLASRITLTQKEREEVVLKRCWLARYWGLAVKYGICEDAAVSKHEHWSSLASLPFEIVVSAGQKAKQTSLSNADSKNYDTSKVAQDSSDVSGEVTIESMLSVEMGLQELSSLKIEDAVVRALSQQRLLNTTVRSSQAELGAEEAEDFLFKEAWLTYFWRRALTEGIEEHIAAERLNFWKDSGKHTPTALDAIAVEKGIAELRKLGIERRLWTAPRKN